MVIYVVVDCNKFPRDKNLNQQWFIKIKHRNIQSI